MHSYLKLTQRLDRIAKLNHLLSIVGWDEQVNMPDDSGDSRAAAMAEGSLMAQELLLAPELDDLANKADLENLDSTAKANLKAIKRQIDGAKAVPSELNHALTLAVMKCHQHWRELRKNNDWPEFVKVFEPVVRLSREHAEARAAAFCLTPYDALLDMYQEGISTAFLEKVFGGLKTWLPELIESAVEKQPTFQVPLGHFSVEDQRSIGLEVAGILGFNFRRGRLDVSHHPFCGGVSSDVRMTTRYSTDDFTQSLMGIIHETGHGLYEQGLPPEYEFQPVGSTCGMMIHESQSLLFEMQISRSRQFLEFLSPIIKKRFGDRSEFSSSNLCRIYQNVKPGLIRIDADEVTYPAHILLRYEIEKKLIGREISVQDIPDLWDEKMKAYLGISTRGNDRDGCLQDVHWPTGSFGYFPCYTLGAMLAAQLFQSYMELNTKILEEVSIGDTRNINAWLNEKIWSKGSSLHPFELIKNATGSELSDNAYRAHLERRYLNRD